MIKLVRIDERLVHGQVAVVWTKTLNVNRIVVADDKAAADETQKYAMSMAVPDGVKLAVLPLSKAVSVLNDPRAKNLSIFVVVRNPSNALKLVKEVREIKAINVGNFGRMSGGDVTEKRGLGPNLYVTPDDIKDLNSISEQGIQLEYQVVPSDKAIPVSKLLNKEETGE